MCAVLPKLGFNMVLKLEVRFGISRPPCGQPRRFLRAGGSLKGLCVEWKGENSSHTFKVYADFVLHQIAHETLVGKFT